MKILIALGVVQVVLILYLVGNFNKSSTSSQQAQAEQLTTYSSQLQVDPDPYSNLANLDEVRLRQIIREELAQHVVSHVPMNEMSTPGRTHPMDQYSKDEVEFSIDQLKGIGEISDQKLLALEAKIVT